MSVINKLLERDIVFFDIETTGLSIKNDRIIQIYAIKYKMDGSKLILSEYINPLIPISKEAFGLHGINDDFIKDYPSMNDLHTKIYNFINNCDFGGYNCLSFDIPFLFEELSRYNEIININVNIIDSYSLLLKMESRKLGDVYKRMFGKEISQGHNSKYDTEATVEIFENQLKMYELEGTKISDISDIVRGDYDGNRTIDLSGWFVYKDSDFYYSKGTHKNERVSSNIDYLKWIINSNKIENNSRMVAKKILDRIELSN